MADIYLIRHCKTSGQEPEAPLMDLGHSQAANLAETLAPMKFKRIVSSPYLRARQSAAPLAEKLEIQIETDERLRERTLGVVPSDDWLGGLARTFVDENLNYPNGESSATATARAIAAIEDIVEGGVTPVAIFTHGNLLSLIARSFDPQLGFEFWQGLQNPDVFEVIWRESRRELRRIAL